MGKVPQRRMSERKESPHTPGPSPTLPEGSLPRRGGSHPPRGMARPTATGGESSGGHPPRRGGYMPPPAYGHRPIEADHCEVGLEAAISAAARNSVAVWRGISTDTRV